MSVRPIFILTICMKPRAPAGGGAWQARGTCVKRLAAAVARRQPGRCGQQHRPVGPPETDAWLRKTVGLRQFIAHSCGEVGRLPAGELLRPPPVMAAAAAVVARERYARLVTRGR